MSEENGKVCCNCRHNIRTDEITNIECHCDIDNHYIGYIACMEHWCKHWSRDRAETEAEDGEDTTAAFRIAVQSIEKLEKIKQVVDAWKTDKAWSSFDCMNNIMHIFQGEVRECSTCNGFKTSCKIGRKGHIGCQLWEKMDKENKVEAN